MYTYLNAAVKHALARYNIAPSLDFTLSPEIQQLSSVQLPVTHEQKEDTEKGYLYNTFTNKNQAHFAEKKDSLKQWKELYQIAQTIPSAPAAYTEQAAPTLHVQHDTQPSGSSHNILLVQGSMLLTTVKSGLMLIHIRRAQERIWYERLLQEWNEGQTASQQLLFPLSYELPPQDALLLTEALPDLARMGFDISPFGQYTFVVQGVPTSLPAGEERNVLDEVVEQLKHESGDAVAKRSETLVANMARRLSRNINAMMQPEAQQALIDELFACTQPEYAPDGRKVFTMIRKEELDNMLG
jgi:DNA mismatch repair protein MutL